MRKQHCCIPNRTETFDLDLGKALARSKVKGFSPVGYIYVIALLFLPACSAKQQGGSQTIFQPQSDRKQKQKVIVLEKKLSLAEKTLLQQQVEVEAIRVHLCEAELDVIESELRHVEQRWQTDPARLVQSFRQGISDLFLEERERLHRIIQSGPAVHRAQNLLDRILQLITQISDRGQSHQFYQ